jgi:hypothetical protein
MSIHKNKQFAQKHKSDVKPDNLIKEEILKHSVKGKLNFRLAKCQLGLYGYQPKKRKVKPKMPLDQGLKNAITDALVEGKLTCKKVWDIASLYNVHKFRVSCACEAMKIKIIKCQLGAF